MFRRYNRHLYSLGPGSAVGEKGKKQGQTGKISASELLWRGKGGAFPEYLTAHFARRFYFSPTPIFSPLSHNAEPGPRISSWVLAQVAQASYESLYGE